MKLRSLLLSNDSEIVHCWSTATSQTAVDLDLVDNAKALDCLNGEKYEAIIIDARVAGADEAVRAVRDTPSSKDAVVVVMAEPEKLGSLLVSGASIAVPLPLRTEVAVRCLRTIYPLMRRDRRRYARFTIKQPCTVSVAGQKLDATVLNVSEYGVALGEIMLQLNAHLQISYKLPEGGVVTCAGTVVWSKESGQAGIRVTEISEASRLVLNRWLDARLEAELQTAEILVRRLPKVGPLS